MRRRHNWIKILVIILLVDAVLIAGLYWLYKRNKLPSDVQDLHAQMKTLGKAIDLYYQDCKTFPSEAQGLGALMAPPKDEPRCEPWAGPYLEDTSTQDPWGRAFVYKRDGEFFSLMTLGADGRPGGTGRDNDVTLEDL